MEGYSVNMTHRNMAAGCSSGAYSVFSSSSLSNAPERRDVTPFTPRLLFPFSVCRGKEKPGKTTKTAGVSNLYLRPSKQAKEHSRMNGGRCNPGVRWIQIYVACLTECCSKERNRVCKHFVPLSGARGRDSAFGLSWYLQMGQLRNFIEGRLRQIRQTVFVQIAVVLCVDEESRAEEGGNGWVSVHADNARRRER